MKKEDRMERKDR